MRILLAEDERITRRSLQRELEKWGHEVVAVEDGAEAWEAYGEGGFDIVLTDWEMPRLDGLELVRRIHQRETDEYVYLIMLTGRSDKNDVVAGIEAGADDFLSKPWDRGELRVRLVAGERIITLERRLAEQNQALSRANERMRHDLVAASRVQQELLPKKSPSIGDLTFAWHYQPCEELGGDLLNIVPIGDDTAALYLADVSGHGAASSLTAVSVHRSLSASDDPSSLILRAAGEGRAPTNPDEVAERLNALYPMATNGGHFLTLVYSTIDTSGRFSYCAAGHQGPIVASGGEPARSLDTHGLPIGVIDVAGYTASTLQLKRGDRVYLYSDGLMEARHPERGMFGRERIEQLIDGARGRSLQESIQDLVDAVVEWQTSSRFEDDLSLLAVEV